jgi:hypothetical protein
MAEVAVDIDTIHWNRQEYVLEAIDGLYDECIIDEDDKDYKKGKNSAVDNHYGPE